MLTNSSRVRTKSSPAVKPSTIHDQEVTNRDRKPLTEPEA
jgi:hypothetical protein